jgi:hypothetical protein
VASANELKLSSVLEKLEEIEKQLLIQKRQLLVTLDKWQSMFDRVTDKKSRLLALMEQKVLSEQQKSENKSSHKIFSVVASGPSRDKLVFTVMAENYAWAEEMVLQWLNSNGREDHKIEKVMALVSQDVRAVVNVGAKCHPA